MGSEALPQQVGDHIDNVATSIHTLSPLPPVLKHGLAAVSFFGFLSFLSTVSLLGYLSFKILKWTLRTSQPTTYSTSKVVTVQEHDLPDEHLCPQPAGPVPQLLPQTTMWKRLRDDPPNQFLVLILNLLFADVQQALAFLLNAAWLARDGVVVGNSMCWAQGWFVSTGDLASSVFISLIAVHTYLSVVHSYHMQTWAFYTMIASGWFFNYFMAILGVIITNNGADTGGLYVRAGGWCWVNRAYQDLRFALHYLWIFISLGVTSALYLIVFLYIRRIARANPDNNSLQRPPHMKRGFSSTAVRRRDTALDYAKKQTFLLYPIIYVCCTMPLAAGRVASMAGSNPSLGYFCFAAAMIASNGWLDVLLYATTRRSIVFSDNPSAQDTGLETFTFMRTPNRRFGNVVFVAGGADATDDGMNADALRGRKKIGSLGKLARLRGEAGSSEVSLRGKEMGSSDGGAGGGVLGAIQMETVTSVVVEVDHSGETSRGSGRKGSLASDAVSIASRV
ncbi:G protein-coupled glucose receptor regulating Gpa2-domain-containing protein [Plectosphaerella cucumerina]|uniref:G protein-coupled glucose receptor regulating Gpa2-domain-containing protein n=1 Tax=Plectosphaerella cucumerina TaxID=40658 RepID=A0A8K0TGJ1_9PEZI|nr:G protein-coupled glucose receptor regulating Gpa2-domain-containing protein [Plectosphaerella cucumerina]